MYGTETCTSHSRDVGLTHLSCGPSASHRRTILWLEAWSMIEQERRTRIDGVQGEDCISGNATYLARLNTARGCIIMTGDISWLRDSTHISRC